MAQKGRKNVDQNLALALAFGGTAPISWVRSKMLISIVLVMPSEATNSATKAINPVKMLRRKMFRRTLSVTYNWRRRSRRSDAIRRRRWASPTDG